MEMKSLIIRLQQDLPVPSSKNAGTLEELTEVWAEYFNELIQNDFQYLVSLLYRIDVSETRLRQLLRENPGQDAGRIIAAQVIERLLQKIRSREAYRSRDSGPGNDVGDELW